MVLAGIIKDLLYPSTDAGAEAQFFGVMAATALIVGLVRRERSLVLLTLGVASLVLGFFGLRGLH